jgi:flagellar FliL protein
MVIEMMPEDMLSPAPEPKRSGKWRMPIIAGAAVLLLLGAAGGGYLLLGRDGGEPDVAAPQTAAADAYVEAPAMLVNLHSADGQARFLKLRFIIVAADAARAETIKAKLPMVLDALQPFLRELRPEDLNGSAAIFRVKEEMMVRAVAIFGTGAVRDILIQDLVQQ